MCATPIMEEEIESPRRNFNGFISADEQLQRGGSPVTSENERVQSPRANQTIRTDANVTPLQLKKKDKTKESKEDDTKTDGDDKPENNELKNDDKAAPDSK